MTTLGPFKRAIPISAAVSGTATASIDEDDIVSGGETIIITLTGDTWVAAGATFDAVRQDIINGLDSAQSEANGWDAEVKANLPVTAVVRTSDTVVTITLTAQASYDITASETVTVTVPASALVKSNTAVIATPDVTIDVKVLTVMNLICVSLPFRTIAFEPDPTPDPVLPPDWANVPPNGIFNIPSLGVTVDFASGESETLPLVIATYLPSKANINWLTQKWFDYAPDNRLIDLYKNNEPSDYWAQQGAVIGVTTATYSY